MSRQRVRGVRLAGGILVAVILAIAWTFTRQWLELPGVPYSVVKSVASEDVHIVAQGHDSSPSNDWEDSYVLLKVSPGGDPVGDIDSALRSAGWKTSAGGAAPLLLSGDKSTDKAKYGVTVLNYEDFECLDRPQLCDGFKNAAKGHDGGLFVATFMPYV
ncbi:hypothetical protein LRR80_01267 [Streptomyces sp. RO-S4]|uniref:hypothetical protein n=1 Tax=unclassified Streptomyces TaxID=2593676 RepID=UPI00208E3EFF|nr:MULTISPECIES: hypothetical protein [unclassified Streptomyces]MCO4695219.1 hypothetical protein [Streptomyces sp. RO-S4]MDU0302437.1 hypothetical protein [Streptomyces sp. PAL114]